MGVKVKVTAEAKAKGKVKIKVKRLGKARRRKEENYQGKVPTVTRKQSLQCMLGFVFRSQKSEV